MDKYSYRYSPLFCKYEDGMFINNETIDVDLLEVEDFLVDGSHDRTHSDTLLRMHTSGRPKQINLHWMIGKKDYWAHFLLDEDIFDSIFQRFYGAHPETKTDFIIRIDAENKKYELALYRQGLKEPVVIPESAYQLIVFKNKFEDYRSENYNQPRGAWIW